jgi:tetratricopeptide (TPR) repeat protein
LFDVERDVGAGATGFVQLARLRVELEALAPGSAVAVKRLRPELARDPAARAAFEREARAGLAVRHPGLASVLHAGVDDAGPYHVLPYVPGRTLVEALEQGPLPEPQLRAVASQVAGGLAALHAAGWAHGDVKPENMRLDDSGRAVLLDLGFVEPVHSDPASPLPRRGTDRQSGSLAYLAPERARGQPATPAADVFALGISIYEMATGAHPFVEAAAKQSSALARPSSGRILRRSIERPGADSVLAALAAGRFIPPSRLVPQLSPFLDAVCAEALQRDPRARPSAIELSQWLSEGEGGAWWRSRLDEGALARRGVMGEPTAAHLLPLVGRERELEQLHSIWSQRMEGPAAARSGTAVWLLGPEGSGKSRLTSDFAAQARLGLHPPVYLYGRCSGLELQRPCEPVLRLMQRWLQLPESASLGARERARLQRLVAPATARALELALSTEPEEELETDLSVPLATWIEALARTSPLIVYLDDVNFADEGTLRVLGLVGDRLRSVPALLVLGEREHEEARHPELLNRLRARLLAQEGATELRLTSLDQAAVGALVARLFHHTAPQARIAEVLWNRSRGNPGLLGEILRGLIERGQAQPFSAEESQLTLRIAPERLPMPESLRTMIQERARKLSAEERRWLQRLSVVGGRIAPEFLLRAFQGGTRPELDLVLTRLVASGWLVPAGARYRFARPALREAVYRAISPQRRRRLHALAASALAPQVGPDGTPGSLTLDDAFQRAFHLRSAGEQSALLRVLDPLITALLRRAQRGRVHTLAQWGLEALDTVRATRERRRQRLRFLEAAADAADRLGEREFQRQWLDRLSDLDLTPERDAPELARVYLLHGRFAAGTGQYGLARGMLRNAVDLAKRAGSAELESETLRRLAAVQTHVGELEEAQNLIERALELAAHPAQEALAWLQQALIQILRDEIEEALRSVDRTLRLLRRSSGWSLPGVHAAAHMLRGRIYRLAGRPRRAIGALQRAVRLAELSGERRLEMEATARLGGLLVELDRPSEAERRLREALLMAGEIEDRRGRALASLWLGTLLWEQGDAEGPRLLASSAELASDVGLGRVEALARAILARSAHGEGRAEDALAQSARAAELLEAHGAELADRIVIVGTRALLLRAAGEEQAAERSVAALEKRIRRENKRLENSVLQQRHRTGTARLLEAALSDSGRVYPRVALDDAAFEPDATAEPASSAPGAGE